MVKQFLITFAALLLMVSVAPATELSVTGERFVVDGKPTFLLGCSYYGALGAPDTTISADLDQLQRLHFNWIRVWADWTAFGADLSAVDGATGDPRQPYLDKLVNLCADCDRRGMIVDVTFTRGKGVGGKPMLSDRAAQRRAVETVTKALAGAKNWYLDLSNERNIRDARYTSVSELADLREAVRRINPKLLVTASNGGDASREEVLAYLNTAHLNFLSIHRPRDAQSAARVAEATHEYRDWIKQNGRVVPLMYDEPFRRGYAKWEPTAQDFSNDLKASRDAGAAGWCFHNGDSRKSKDHEPRRSFDLRNHSLFDQLDVEEKKFLADLSQP
jgi:hypothetical protein